MGQLEDILKHQNMVRNNIMKSFGLETSEDSLEKSFEDEVNPFEMEAYKSELTKAELDEFEKAKHQDGDMHPNGKWVWRQSANGGKGDWRVAKPGGSKATAGSTAATTSNKVHSSTSKQTGDENKKNTVTHDINGTKVTVTKNRDGSYTLEANGKKVKSDDPSFFVNGTNLKPRVKAALAKEVGLEMKKASDKKKTSDKTTSSASNEEKFSDMDIKEARKKLVGKNLTFKNYWIDGKGESVDATGKITNVRLYGKNKQPVALVEFENGDSATVSIKQIDEGKAAGYDLSLSNVK